MPPTTFIKAFMLTYSLQIIYKIYKVPIVKNSHTNTEWVCVRRGPRHRVSSQYLKEALCGRRRDCCTVRVVSNVSYQAVCERFINQSSPDNSTVTARNTQSSSSSLPVMQRDSVGGSVPPGAVVGGQDCNGEPIYVARAQHEGAMIPGKLVASHGVTFVAWGGQEHGKPQYQVLVGGPNNWIRTNGSNVPPGAFPGGESEDGEPLFIGRVNHEGSLTTGKVQQSHGVCYIPFAGQELGFPEYEILMP